MESVAGIRRACRGGRTELTTDGTITKDEARAKIRELAAEFAARGNELGWFDAAYSAAEGRFDRIPWAEREPNRFFKEWAERNNLTGRGRKALIVGCGLGDDARYLYDLGFNVTAFDISPTAVEWAKRLHADRRIQFEVADLFEPFRGWVGTFDFVLEIYTIQPLPIELRQKAIDSIASFVGLGGELVVVCRGRDDDEEVPQMPWPLSRRDLSRFEKNGLQQIDFNDFVDDEDTRRFVVKYERPS
jgi:SAM-dependent methyltransferase